jgi:hypothetical protein
MRTLAALMFSMTVLATALLAHALVATNQSPAAQPASLADRVRDDHGLAHDPRSVHVPSDQVQAQLRPV